MSALNITNGGSYTIAESDLTITIATSEAVTLTGNSNTELSEVVITTTAENANLTINNLNITNNSTAIITFGDGTENNLNVTGTNVFEVKNAAGACVNVGGGLTINGTGSFKGTSISGAVIGINGNQYKPNSNITIESGTFDLTCRSGACAIGGAGARGNAIGNITITGTANITAKAPLGHAAPIGASYWGSCGDILINGDSKVNATSGQHSAAIGGASLASVGNITINGNAEVTATNASLIDDSAAIGSGLGAMVQSLGDIFIGGNAKVTASSNLGLAIDNIEWHREHQQYGTTDEGDYPVVNDNTITIGENATFTGKSGDIYTATTINGEEFRAANISYNSTDGLKYSGGSIMDKEALEETLLDITSGGAYTIAEGSYGKILVNTSDPVTLQGGDYTLEEIQIVGQSDSIDLTINDLKVLNDGSAASVIKFGSGSDNKLTVTGENDFNIKKGSSAGVNIGGGGTIGGTGSLTVLTLNGAAIGTNGQEDLGSSNLVIDSGTFDLKSRSGACGIGGAGNDSKIGNITITGTAHVKADTPQGYAAAIGSSYRGTVGDILINGDATVEATSGLQTAAIGAAVYCENGDITIGGRASVVANTTSTDVKDAAIGGTYGEQMKSIGDIKITDDATVIASSAHGLALDNLLYIEGKTYQEGYWTTNTDSKISILNDTTTSAQSTVILTNGDTADTVIIGNKAYQGGKMVFYDGALAMTGNWTTLDSGGWEYNSIVQMDYTTKTRGDKSANLTLSGGNLKDEDRDGIPDNVSIGSIIYVQKSGVHTNVRNLSGNVIYNGDALGVEGDDSYNIEAVSPIDLSEEFPLKGYYITDPRVTAMRLISNGATISPHGNAGTGDNPADWYSFDNAGGTVTFRDGSFCLYPERYFSSRDYTKVDISNGNKGVKITESNDLIQTISNLADGYEITIESGIAVGEKINFETSGNGVIAVKTTANTGKYSLAADSDEWQYQRYSITGGNDFTFVFGENGSVTGMENFDGTLTTEDTTLTGGTWVTLSSGGFEYTGVATNNPSKSATFTVSGDAITSTDNLSVPHNLYVSVQGGNRIELAGLNGNASLDNINLGIDGDSDYSAHFTATNDGIRSNIALMEVSDGASVNNNYSIGIDDSNAQIKFSDGNHVIFTNSYFPTQNFTTINADNSDNGFTLNVNEDKFETISGLTDGYAISINAGGNISDSVAIHTDGGQGVVSVKSGNAAKSFQVSGDEDFGVQITASNSIELVDFEGWLTVGDGVYQYVSDLANFTISGENFDPTVAKVLNNVQADENLYRIGLAGLNDNVTVGGAQTGVFNDSDYSIHAAISATNAAATVTSAFNISDGASINGAVKSFLLDDNAGVDFVDGNYTLVTAKNYSTRAYDTVSVYNSGNGFKLQNNSSIDEISGLVDGFNVSIVPNSNVGTDLTFKTDGGDGTITFSDDVYKVSGDDEFTFGLDENGKVESLKNFSGQVSPTASITSAHWSLNGGNAAYKDTSNTAGYILNDEKITYLEEHDGNILVTLSGVNSIDGLSIDTDNSIVTVSAAALNESDVAISDDYKLALAEDVPAPERVDATWSRSDNTFYYTTSGRTAGYSLIGNQIIYSAEIIGEPLTFKNTTELTGGSEDETVTPENYSMLICNNFNSHINMAKAQNVTIVPYAGTVNLDNYDASTDSAIFVLNVDNIADAIKDNSIQLSGNEIYLDHLDSDTGVKFSEDNTSRLAKLVLADGSSQKVGFTTGNGFSLNTSAESGNFILKGDNDSTITAGNGNDTILASANNIVDAGNGQNQIYLPENGNSTVVTAGKEYSTVFGFNTGYDYGSDYVKVEDISAVKFNSDNSGLMITAGAAHLQFDGLGLTTVAAGEKILLTDDNSTLRAAVAKNNQTITVTEDATPNIFFGKNSGLNFSNYGNEVSINLSEGTGSIGSENATISGFNKVQAGTGVSTLIGNSERNTLSAGINATSIWGGAGNDKLVGTGNSSDKSGQTEFFFFAGDGRDTISNFAFINPDNRYSDTYDIINIGDSTVKGAYRHGNNVGIAFEQNSYLVLEDAVGKDFRIADIVAKVDVNIAYDGLADYYLASGGSSLTADSTVDSAEIWLDNSHGTQFVGNIRTLNASAVEGTTTLVGNDFNNTILAGRGDSSLWGGDSYSNDLLSGGYSQNTFFYSAGDGNDTIQGVNDGDFVILSDISLEEISSANISSNAVAMTFADGGSLKINGTADVTYQLVDGSRYSANHSQRTWTAK